MRAGRGLGGGPLRGFGEVVLAPGEAQGRGDAGYGVGAVVDGDAVGDDVVGGALEEGLVGVQEAGAELVAVEVGVADEDGPVDDGGHLDAHLAGGVGGGERAAGDAVVAGQEKGCDEVGKPAVVDVVLVEVLLCQLELLTPVGSGVRQVEVGFGWASPKGVGVGHVVGEHAD